jgi:nucleotide-binding universal stress UspA family protein
MAVLLVPTDFSTPADNALHFAAQLAARAGATIHLLHIYKVPEDYYGIPTIGADGGFMPVAGSLVPIEDVKAAAEEHLNRHAASFIERYPNISVTVVARMGGVTTDDINEYAAEVGPLAIVMGAHPLHGLDNLVGSTTVSLARHLHFPVIAVPEKSVAEEGAAILLAIDNEPVPEAAAQSLRNFAGAIGASISVMHVRTGNGAAPEVPASLASGQLVYTVVENDDVTAGVREHLQHHPAAMLAVLPHHHSLWSQLFGKQHTKELVLEVGVPVLCFSEGA